MCNAADTELSFATMLYWGQIPLTVAKLNEVECWTHRCSSWLIIMSELEEAVCEKHCFLKENLFYVMQE